MESTTDWIWAVDMLGSKIFTFGPKSGAAAAVAVRCEAAPAGPASASAATASAKNERCKIIRLPLGRSTRGVCHPSTGNASAGTEREREEQSERDRDHRPDEPRDERPPAAEEQPDYGHDDRPRHRNENREPRASIPPWRQYLSEPAEPTSSQSAPSMAIATKPSTIDARK